MGIVEKYQGFKHKRQFGVLGWGMSMRLLSKLRDLEVLCMRRGDFVVHGEIVDLIDEIEDELGSNTEVLETNNVTVK